MHIKGIVTRVESKNVYVRNSEGDTTICSLRGKFKKQYSLKKGKLNNLDIVIVGDHVEYEIADETFGVITAVDERANYLSRKSPKIKGAGLRGERLEQVIASNIDNIYIVLSIFDPDFNNRLLDRIIVAAESSKINVNIVINKIDLDEENIHEDWAYLYEDIGYKVFPVSATDNVGIDKLKASLKGKVNIFWGPSGVGKSSLLNTLYDDLNLKTGEISEWSGKGKHTTVTAVLMEVENSTFVIDTPGVREIEPYGIKKEDLGFYFVDIAEYAGECKFNTCTHHHEPGCAVIKAVEEELIYDLRYHSYLTLLETIEDDLFF